MSSSKPDMALKMRTANAGDEAGVSRLCLLTADSGKDATSLYSQLELPGMIWAVPYVVHSPEHCFVVESGSKLVGYIVTTPNSSRFEQWQRETWWPLVHRKLEGFESSTEADKAAMRTIANSFEPEPDFFETHPAHLHINLLPEAQGTGFGRKLMTAALDKLKNDGVSGIHLGVSFANTNAIGFYKAMGFTELARTGALMMGKSL